VHAARKPEFLPANDPQIVAHKLKNKRYEKAEVYICQKDQRREKGYRYSTCCKNNADFVRNHAHVAQEGREDDVLNAKKKKER
jgi:hypothetical protein